MMGDVWPGLQAAAADCLEQYAVSAAQNCLSLQDKGAVSSAGKQSESLRDAIHVAYLV